jgi:hypothetical protein
MFSSLEEHYKAIGKFLFNFLGFIFWCFHKRAIKIPVEEAEGV